MDFFLPLNNSTSLVIIRIEIKALKVLTSTSLMGELDTLISSKLEARVLFFRLILEVMKIF